MSRKKSTWGRGKPPWYGRTRISKVRLLEAKLTRKREMKVKYKVTF